jgi:hypothetical protein
MDLPNPVRKLKPAVARDAIWTKRGWMNIENRSRVARNSGFHPPVASLAHHPRVASGPLLGLYLAGRRREVEHTDSITTTSFSLSTPCVVLPHEGPLLLESERVRSGAYSL